MPGGQCSLHHVPPSEVATYHLARAFQGKNFFEGWAFGEHDWTAGSSQYMNRSVAEAERMIEARDTHAIIRTGGRGDFLRRKSVRLTTQDSWMYALVALRFTHVPYGCGVWPAFWMNSGSGHWPDGGELDILEYVNFGDSRISFHTGGSKHCKLEPAVIQDCDDFETGRVSYNCYTDYEAGLNGCGPAKASSRRTGEEWAQSPGVLAAEWNAAGIKVFYFSEPEIPADLLNDQPRPDAWNANIIAYFPFAASQQVLPGLCPAPATLLEPQSIVLNIALCGSWASEDFLQTCSERIPEVAAADGSGRCLTIPAGIDSHLAKKDCCMSFVYDQYGDYGAEKMLQTAFFNITWLKVYQTQFSLSEVLTPSPPPFPPGMPPPSLPPSPPPAFLSAPFPWSVLAVVELLIIVVVFSVLLIPSLHKLFRTLLFADFLHDARRDPRLYSLMDRGTL
eukprot:6205586-Pleurochrysis_carterae.AAC.2